MFDEQLYGTIEHLASYSVLLPALVCVIRIKALNLTLWALFIYLILCFVVDQFYLGLLPNQEKANRLINCWTVVECSFFCFIYFREAMNVGLKRTIAAVFTSFLLLSLLFFNNNLVAEDKVVLPAEAGLVIAFSVSAFIQMIFDRQTGKLIRNYFFWINCALLLYFCTAILIFIENDELLYLSEHEPMKARQIWVVHDMIKLFANILITVGICLWKRTPIQL